MKPPGKPRNTRRTDDFAYGFLPDGAAIEHRPYPRLARLSVPLLSLLLAAAVAWAALSEVDRVVTGAGKVITTEPLLIVQPLETAIVRTLDVTAGDRVGAGARLATLDPTFAAADLADLSARRVSIQAQINRLRAELDGSRYDPAADGPNGALHATILERRQAEHRSRLAAFDEQAATLAAQIANGRQAQSGLAERIKLVTEIETMRHQLMEKQISSRLAWLDASAERMRLRDELRAMHDREREYDHEQKRLAAERAGYIDEWRRKTVEELVEQTGQHATLTEQIAKAERRRTLVTLTAPVDAVVLEVARRSVGSVVKEAEPLITLVPADVPLEVEAELPSADIGLVRVGDPARIKLDAFPFQRHGTLPGTVRTISADAFAREARDGGGAVFRVRVRLLASRPEALPEGTRISPGMTASAEIRVGTRSVLSYFLYPILRALDESIREP